MMSWLPKEGQKPGVPPAPKQVVNA
jgi:hypothetical protein